MPSGRFSVNESAYARKAIARTLDKQSAQDAAAQHLYDVLVAEKRCVRCGMHCPTRYDYMLSHLCGDCFWNENR